MGSNYENRKIKRHEVEGKLIVSTVRVMDSEFLYETAICHRSYNLGLWVIVANYNTKKEAEAGHEEWIKTMTSDKLPDQLIDVSGSWIGQLAKAGGMNTIYKREDLV